jgi:hypothetical protein
VDVLARDQAAEVKMSHRHDQGSSDSRAPSRHRGELHGLTQNLRFRHAATSIRLLDQLKSVGLSVDIALLRRLSTIDMNRR